MEDFTKVIVQGGQHRLILNDQGDGHNYRVVYLPGGLDSCLISFQQGPVTEDNPVNGVTNENLLAILIDRTQKLNAKFPCRENSLAITKMEEALMWFEKRTANRKARGVEGKEVL